MLFIHFSSFFLSSSFIRVNRSSQIPFVMIIDKIFRLLRRNISRICNIIFKIHGIPMEYCTTWYFIIYTRTKYFVTQCNSYIKSQTKYSTTRYSLSTTPWMKYCVNYFVKHRGRGVIYTIDIPKTRYFAYTTKYSVARYNSQNANGIRARNTWYYTKFIQNNSQCNS